MSTRQTSLFCSDTTETKMLTTQPPASTSRKALITGSLSVLTLTAPSTAARLFDQKARDELRSHRPYQRRVTGSRRAVIAQRRVLPSGIDHGIVSRRLRGPDAVISVLSSRMGILSDYGYAGIRCVRNRSAKRATHRRQVIRPLGSSPSTGRFCMQSNVSLRPASSEYEFRKLDF